MYRHGHLGANLLLTAPVVAVLLFFNQLFLAAAAALVIPFPSSLPDRDMKISFLTHRGFSHTVWAALLFGAVLTILLSPLWMVLSVLSLPDILLFGLGFGTVGYIGHIAADALTPMGVRPFAPAWDTHISLDLWTASNDVANSLLLFLGILALILSVTAQPDLAVNLPS